MQISYLSPHLTLFLLYPIFVYAGLTLFIRPGDAWQRAVIFVLSFVAGPAIAALFLELLYLFFQRESLLFYSRALIGLPIVGMTAILGWRVFQGESLNTQLMTSGAGVSELGKVLRPRTFAQWLAALVLLALIIILTAISVYIPLYANDPLGYQYVARLFFERGTTDFYPLSSPLENGYYAVSSHPLVYYLLITSGMILSGISDPYFIKHISPFYLLCGVALILVVGSRYSRLGAWLGAILYVTTPLVFFLTYQASIDQIKNVTFFAALVSLCLFFFSVKPRPLVEAIMCGLFVGLAMAVHSLNGLLMLPIIASLVLARSYFNFRETHGTTEATYQTLKIWVRQAGFADFVKPMFLIAGMATLIGGGRYIANLIQFGTPISDTLPLIARMPELNYGTYMVLTRDRDGIFDLVLNGVFAGLTDPATLGIGMYVAVVALLIVNRKALRDPIIFTLLGAYILFHIFVLLLLVAGKVSIANNARYMLGPTILAASLLPAIFLRIWETLQVAQINGKSVADRRWLELVIRRAAKWLRKHFSWVDKALIGSVTKRLSHAESEQVDRDLIAEEPVTAQASGPLTGRLIGSIVFLFAIVLVTYATLAQCLFQSAYIVARFSQDLGLIDRPHDLSPKTTDRTRKFFSKAQRILTPNARVLYFRQSTFSHFLKNDGIRHVDPRLEAFYKSNNVRDALSVLRKLGIDYVYSPGYALATGLHPNVWKILSDPSRVDLVAQVDGQRLYRLRSSEKASVQMNEVPDADVVFNNNCIFDLLGTCLVTLNGDIGYFRKGNIKGKYQAFIGTTFAEFPRYAAASATQGLYRFEVEATGYGLLKIEARVINYLSGAPYDTLFTESWPVGEVMAIRSASRYAGLFHLPEGYLLKGIRVLPKSGQTDLSVGKITMWHVTSEADRTPLTSAKRRDWTVMDEKCTLKQEDAVDSDFPQVGKIIQDVLRDERDVLVLLENDAGECKEPAIKGRLYAHVDALLENASTEWFSKWRNTVVKVSTYLGLSPNFPGRYMEIQGEAGQPGHVLIEVLMRDALGGHYISSCGWLRHLQRGRSQPLQYKCSLPVRVSDTPIIIRYSYRRTRANNDGFINELYLKFGDRRVVERIIAPHGQKIESPKLKYRVFSLDHSEVQSQAN